MTDASSSQRPVRPSFAEALRFWLKLGFISFGGPTGQIAIMHEELVERRRWISEDQFLHALNYCMVLPGPEAQQLAIYSGWLLHQTAGGIVAGALFVLPSAAILWGLSWSYVTFGHVPWITGVFAGLKPAVVAIIAVAVVRIGSRALRSRAHWVVAALAFAALQLHLAPFPAVIALAALAGWIGHRLAPRHVPATAAHAIPPDATTSSGATTGRAPGALARAAKVIAVCGLLWWIPILAVRCWLGSAHAVVHEGLLFSRAAMVTFGGAYAVLPWVAERAVQAGWLSAPRMLDGMALAETTPGPLIMVLQFVGFLGGWNAPGPLSPLAAATLGAAITTWATFVPCFLWIFLGAPYIERLRENARLSAALAAVTAAVVGVVLNLAVTFAFVVFRPGGAGVDWSAVALGAAALVALQRLRWGTIPVVLASGAVGALLLLVRGG